MWKCLAQQLVRWHVLPVLNAAITRSPTRAHNAVLQPKAEPWTMSCWGPRLSGASVGRGGPEWGVHALALCAQADLRGAA